jgi:streptogramin lyase
VVGSLLLAGQSSPPSRVHLALHDLLHMTSVSSVAEADGDAWTTNDVSDVLTRFDPADGHGRTSVKLKGRPVAVIFAAGAVWVASMISNTVEEVAARTLKLVRTFQVPDGPSGLVVLDGRIWVTSVFANDVTPIKASDGVLGRVVHVPGGAVRVAAGFGALWVTGTTDALTEIQPGTGSGAPILHTATVGAGPIGVATGAGSVWVADASGGTVVQVDPITRQLQHSFHVGGDPLTVAVAGGRVWVADGSADTLRTIVPAPGLPAIDIGATPREMVPVGRGLWIATANPGRVLVAGTASG